MKICCSQTICLISFLATSDSPTSPLLAPDMPKGMDALAIEKSSKAEERTDPRPFASMTTHNWHTGAVESQHPCGFSKGATDGGKHLLNFPRRHIPYQLIGSGLPVPIRSAYGRRI